MRGGQFLSLAGTELASAQRTLAYLRGCLGVGGWEIFDDCECAAYDDGPFVAPDDDPAPWYVAADTRSVDFLGMLLNVRMADPFSRNITARATVGASLGPLKLGHRLVQAEGYLVSASEAGMAYGERWVAEVLRGGVCADDASPGDVCLAPSCEVGALRMLRGAGLVDGPVIDEVGTRADATVQRISFQLASQMPYLYAEPVVVRDAVNVAAGGNRKDIVSTNDWVADKALEIILTAGSTDATALTIEGRISLDGVTCPDTRVPPCFELAIPTLPANSRLTIDTTRYEVVWRNPISLRDESGMHLLEWDESFPWPEVPPCTDLCITVANGGAQAVTYTLRSYAREL